MAIVQLPGSRFGTFRLRLVAPTEGDVTPAHVPPREALATLNPLRVSVNWAVFRVPALGLLSE